MSKIIVEKGQDPFEVLAAAFFAEAKEADPFHKLLCAFRGASRRDETRAHTLRNFWSCASKTVQNEVSFQYYGR
jgi:hypothetical protein